MYPFPSFHLSLLHPSIRLDFFWHYWFILSSTDPCIHPLFTHFIGISIQSFYWISIYSSHLFISLESWFIHLIVFIAAFHWHYWSIHSYIDPCMAPGAFVHPSWIKSFIYACIHPSTHSFIHEFVHWCIRPFIQPSMYSFMDPPQILRRAVGFGSWSHWLRER